MVPRHAGRLLFGSLPWLSKARQEHDVLCEQLRAHGAEVLYFTELLQDILEYRPAREEAVQLAVADASLGDDLRRQLRAFLTDLDSERLAQALIAGLTPEEMRPGHGVVFELLDRHDFVLVPLPNLVFTRDASFWIGNRVAVASLAAGRRREADLAGVVYRHHPRFARTPWFYQPDLEQVSGGDVMLMAPGVVAVGVGQQTTAAGAERLAGRLFEAGLASTVLAVPIGPLRGSGHAGESADGGLSHLDTICTVVGHDVVVMNPAAAYSLTAHTITQQPEGMRVSRAQPFMEAAAQAMSIGRLHVIDSGSEPAWAGPGRWDDGSNVLALAPGLVVSHERNSETNARLEAAGIQVLRVPSSELGSVRGGPRCMTCAIGREPAAMALWPPASDGDGVIREHAGPDLGIAVPRSREATYSGAISAVGAAAASGAATEPVHYGRSADPAAPGRSVQGRWHRGRRGRLELAAYRR
jgi:arginine deiminase